MRETPANRSVDARADARADEILYTACVRMRAPMKYCTMCADAPLNTVHAHDV